METTVRTTKKNNTRIILIHERIYQLCKELWKTILKNREDLSDCDVSMALHICVSNPTEGSGFTFELLF